MIAPTCTPPRAPLRCSPDWVSNLQTDVVSLAGFLHEGHILLWTMVASETAHDLPALGECWPDGEWGEGYETFSQG